MHTYLLKLLTERDQIVIRREQISHGQRQRYVSSDVMTRSRTWPRSCVDWLPTKKTVAGRC